MSRIELKHIDKFYGSNHVLRDINLTIEDGDFMTLLGPSGCGKTTTLVMPCRFSIKSRISWIVSISLGRVSSPFS